MISFKPNAPWFFAIFDIDKTGLPCSIILDDRLLAHHIKTVMRIKSGEDIVIVNESTNQPYAARLEQIENSLITLTLSEAIAATREKKQEIFAAVGLLKGEKWDWLLQKLVELGISGVIPITTKRTVVNIKDPESRHQRWLNIARQAAAQSEQSQIPKIHSVMSLDDLVEMSENISIDFKIIATERDGLPINRVLQEDLSSRQKILFMVGPEGGWEKTEIIFLQNRGFKAVNLGDNILRSETAALYLASVIKYATSS